MSTKTTIALKMLAGSAMLAVAGLADGAQAQTTIDFNANANNSCFVPSVQSNGFTATESTAVDSGQTPMGTNYLIDGQGPSNGTIHLDSWTNYGSNSIWTLTKNDGAAFSLNSFDYESGAYNSYAAATSLTITGITALKTTVTQTFGAYSTFTTLFASPLFGNVTSVEFNATGLRNRAGYDNIVVGNAVAAVPEPASWAMMILGMGAIGYSLRRRVRASESRFDAKIKRMTAGEAA